MGDTVLERNLCFVDTSGSTKFEHIVRYIEQQLSIAVNAVTQGTHDFAGMLSGRGGSQVDVILYLLSKGKLICRNTKGILLICAQIVCKKIKNGSDS